MERTLSQRLAAEFIGTATLIFAGAGSIIAMTAITQNVATPGGGELVGIALAHGLAIGVMVSAMGHISGAHFNPAVTMAMLTTLKINVNDAIGYWIAQLAGAVAAAAILRWSFPEALWEAARLGVPGVSSVSTGQAVVIEAVLTFFLVWVIFASAVDPEGAFGKIAGLAIGLTITMDILMGGPFTGAAMNPARWFGPAALAGIWDDWWVWLVGPLAGGVVAASLYDWVILSKRGTEGPAEETPHGWGAHGEDEDATLTDEV